MQEYARSNAADTKKGCRFCLKADIEELLQNVAVIKEYQDKEKGS